VTRQVERDVRSRLLAVARKVAVTVHDQDLNRIGPHKQGRASATARVASRPAFQPTRMRRIGVAVHRGGSTMVARPEVRRETPPGREADLPIPRILARHHASRRTARAQQIRWNLRKGQVSTPLGSRDDGQRSRQSPRPSLFH